MQEKYYKNLNEILFDFDLYGIKFESNDNLTLNSTENVKKTKNTENSLHIPELIKPAKPNPTNILIKQAKKLAQSIQTISDFPNILKSFKNPLSNCANTICGKFPNYTSGPKLLFLTNMPSLEDDITNELFCNEDGEMLQKMVKNVLNLELNTNCYIMPMIYWRTPGGRSATEEELEMSRPFWIKAINLIQPDLIITLGQEPISWLSQKKEIITKIHGQLLNFESTPVIPLYSLEYLLNNPKEKITTWEDLKFIKTQLK